MDGYEALGYLVYTRYAASGEATHKVVRMFDVKVAGTEWRIHTEPVIEAKGIGFYEVSSSTNDFILKVTGFDAAYNASESPFQELRRELQQSKNADVLFTNPPAPAMPSAYSNALLLPTAGKSPEKAVTNQADNVAIAVVLKGKYPPVDPSYAAFVWFAFTPPNELENISERMLLQVWDDGNPTKPRFRRAKWGHFPNAPQLASDVEYHWVGKERFPDGTLHDINTSDVSKPEEEAAHYKVDSATNFSGLTLPLNFRLTRFTPKRSTRGEQVVSSTMVATVIRLSRFDSGIALEAKVPGKTYVTDYRIATKDLPEASGQYFIYSNTPPPPDQIKRLSSFKGVTAGTDTSRLRSARPWVLLFLCIPSLVALIFLRRFIRRNSPTTKTK